MTILKGIPRILSPDLLSALARMGHGDRLVLADANFPAVSVAASTTAGVLRADGHGIPALLDAILTLFPLDSAVESPCALMQVMPEHRAAGITTPVWAEYQRIADARQGAAVKFHEVERFAFYEEAKRCFAVVATGEEALYGNLIIQKGFLPAEESS